VDNSRKKDKIRIDSVIGYNVRAEREMRKITREELAESMDLTVSHMGLIERGERGATAVTLEKLARVFEVPVDNFFAEPEVVRLSLHEDGRDDDGLLSAKRLKISSLITRFNNHELEFLIHVIKGILALSHHSSPQDSE